MSESVRSIPAFSAPVVTRARRRAARPTAREWMRHTTLFLLTGLTATWAGISFLVPSNEVPEPSFSPATTLDYAIFVPIYYWQSVHNVGAYAFAHPAYIVQGAIFAAALLAILLAHEAGHYVACRRYGVDATLPFFIPVPPPFMSGTLGAFIKIRSPLPSRRALFDIGVAGPLAGFV
ncbi:MAG: site-2 protease family protein, partial [Pyrinomonadaceae bacterium]